MKPLRHIRLFKLQRDCEHALFRSPDVGVGLAPPPPPPPLPPLQISLDESGDGGRKISTGISALRDRLLPYLALIPSIIERDVEGAPVTQIYK